MKFSLIICASITLSALSATGVIMMSQNITSQGLTKRQAIEDKVLKAKIAVEESQKEIQVINDKIASLSGSSDPGQLQDAFRQRQQLRAGLSIDLITLKSALQDQIDYEKSLIK